jgi:predicted nucleotidyltransferase
MPDPPWNLLWRRKIGMYKALERREREREKAIQLASEYVSRLKGDIGVLTAILYGSFARGDFNYGSDIDVLIISDSLPRDTLKRIDLLYRYVQGGIEPKGYTQEEFLRIYYTNNPLAIDALENGEVLSDDGFWISLKTRAEGD